MRKPKLTKQPQPKKLLIIDTFNFLHRAYHAIPKTFTDGQGNPTNAIYGVTSMLVSTFDQIKPDYVVCAVESKVPLLRQAELASYKAHRKPMDENLAVQIPGVFEILNAFGLAQIDVGGYEADDVIGTLVKKFMSEDLEILLLSNDRDLWQLINKNVFVMLPVKDGNIEFVGPEQAVNRLGFESHLIIDYKALKGDSSDNILGVPGIGEKTAHDLVLKFGTLDEIYLAVEHAHPELSPTVIKKLLDNKDIAYKCKKLVTLECDLPLDYALKDFEYSDFSKGRVKEVLLKYNFKSLIRRLGFEAPKTVTAVQNENQLGLF
jgi:DNA polymerase-1